jgi:hypothetical protein
MVRGFLFHNIITPWFEGEPERGMLGGPKPPDGPGLPIAAFRCGECGYLELYAGPEYGPK